MFVRGPFARGGMYQLRTATMVDLIRIAYNVEADQVVGGPNWLEMDRFDIEAAVPAGSTPESQRTMLRELLANRFKLAVHDEIRPIPAYALKVGKQPVLEAADGSGDTGCRFTPPAQVRSDEPLPMAPAFPYSCRNMSMAAFAQGMRRMAGAIQYLIDGPVVDQTGLKGLWNFSLKYTFRGIAGGADTMTIFEAIEKQLGLKLEPVRVPLSVVAVDSVNRKPTENLPGVTERLHVDPAPTEFEVADVKPSAQDSRGTRFNFQPGRVNITGMTLKNLIEQAWDVTDDMLAGAPKWLDTDRFDIVAKTAPPGKNGPMMDIDSVWPMCGRCWRTGSN